MDPYATHLPVLVTALMNTRRIYPLLPILECGCGDYSTLIISQLRGMRRHIIMSSDPNWYQWYNGEVSKIIPVETVAEHQWKDVKFDDDPEYGLCLMDSEELVEHRVKRIPDLLRCCRVVVMHDAHRVPEAKFSYVYSRLYPPTWIGSEHDNVLEWFR